MQTIGDSEFDEVLTSREALMAMTLYLEAYSDRTKGTAPVVCICGDLDMQPNGVTFDPAALDDWIEAVKAVVAQR